MNKIYAFIIVIPMIVILFFKTIAFYEFDTKQRYVKNAIDNVAHKVMITGVLTVGDRVELKKELQKMADFKDEDIVLERGTIAPDGAVSLLDEYVPGSILDRGDIFSIYVQSENQSSLSKMEGGSAGESRELYYSAKAICRVEKVTWAE